MRPKVKSLAQELRFGLALHVGEVLYGSIGGAGPLDFTCIGPAVNLVARLEKVAAQLGRAVIASAEFAQHCRSDMAELGEFLPFRSRALGRRKPHCVARRGDLGFPRPASLSYQGRCFP